MIRTKCYITIFLIGLTSGFNLAPKYAQIVEDPQKQENSYFGYTVMLTRRITEHGIDSWLVVGAPKANSSLSAHRGITEPGVVYQCSLSSLTDECSPIMIDSTGNIKDTVASSDTYFVSRKDNAWIGGSMDVHDEDGGLVVCGHRWTNRKYAASYYLVNGICYWKNETSSTSLFYSEENAEKKLPLIAIENQGYKQQGSVEEKGDGYYYAYGQAGISVHLTKDGKEMLIGAPGVLNWTGTVVRYSEKLESEIPSNRRKRATVVPFGTSDVPNPYYTPKLQPYEYLGYSVDSGKFFETDNVYYVSGAPRSADLKGSVYVFQFPENSNDDQQLQIIIELQGYQFGEYFGSSLCVVDLNGDGLDDLLVGAPLHSLRNDKGSTSSQQTGDEGRVYVFINEDNAIMEEIGDDNKIMGSLTQGSRFGTAISKIGDLNKDGYNDVAVGAPYENFGKGAIYIYHGRKTGINRLYSQRILASEIHPALSGFGISISRGLDIDGNFYNDVAVGAFSSGHSVVIKSLPVISFLPRLISSVEVIGINITSFSVASCISYTGKHPPSSADVHVALNVHSYDARAHFVTSNSPSNVQEYNVTLLQENNEYCQTLQVEITRGGFQDYTKPIEVTMFYEIDNSETKTPRKREINPNAGKFCKACPIVDPNRSTFIAMKVPYATGCGEDRVCQTDLAIKIVLEENMKSPFIIGSQKKLRLRIVVTNIGEPAFLVKVNISFSNVTPLSRLSALCQETGSQDAESSQSIQLECDVANPLETNGKKEFFLDVDMSGLSSQTKALVFSFNASSVGDDANHNDNVAVETLALATLADVAITGGSNQNQVVYSQVNQTFSHTYEVRNHGPSPVNRLKLEFLIPVSLKTPKGVVHFLSIYAPVAYLNSAQPFICTTSGGHSFISDPRESPERIRPVVKRSVISTSDNDVNLPLSMTQLPANKTTVFVNCSSNDVICLRVNCDVGPFVSSQHRAVITFRMKANITQLESTLGKKDIIVITTTGNIKDTSKLKQGGEKHILDIHPDSTNVSTVINLAMPVQTLDTMWLAIAISVGILILMVLVGGLVKIGFFRREKKEELDNMKESDLIDDVLGDMNDNDHL